MSYETIKLRFEETVGYLDFDRTADRNAISSRMIEELGDALCRCEASASVVVLSGGMEYFCIGADLREVDARPIGVEADRALPEALFDLWTRLACGTFVSVAHVRGLANAGGIGFVAACDMVLAQERAQFSLSELLFGLMPACVWPFLLRRIGFQRSHYFTLLTQPVTAKTAHEWGLVDAIDANSEDLLRRHLLRLRRLSKAAVGRYKRYVTDLNGTPDRFRARAVAANLEAFTDPDNRAAIARYVNGGRLPWERR
ncbi:MAG TPA: enoyl-CoA hydratase/isomerase [Steroidobacteraceae bacterium]|jgi:polyketide biosynthesis enoyl-CoA hydratase PksH